MDISLIDFKGYSSLDAQLNGNVVITGKNGEGKTSILEGIIFALFGRNFYGKIATDVFVKKGKPCATAILRMDGTQIKRTQGEGGGVYLNGAKSKVAEIGSLFPTVEMALPVINPLYFMYELSDVNKRELFMKLLPVIDREEVFKKHYSKRKDLVDRFKNTSLRGLRDQINSNETILKANASQTATYNLDIESRKDEIAQKRKDMPIAPKGVLKREKEVQKELEEVQKDLGLLGNPNARIDEYKEELKGYKTQVEPIVEKLKVANITEALQKVESNTEKLETTYREFRESIIEKTLTLEQLKKFEDGKCPLCKQPVTVDVARIAQVEQELTEENMSVIDAKEKLDKYTRIGAQFSTLRDNVVRCVNGMKLHEKKIVRYDNLLKKMKKLESQLVGNNKQDFAKAVEIERRKAEIKLIQNEIMRKKGTVARLKGTSEKLENDLPDLKLLETAMSKKGVDAWIAKEHAKTIEGLISKYMKLKVVTVLENKTNENTKEVFEVTKDGVSFRSMSFGERIKVSVAFGLVLRGLIKGFNLPFVLLDEGSVLSKDSLGTVQTWLNDSGIDLIYTKASNSKLSIKKDDKKTD